MGGVAALALGTRVRRAVLDGGVGRPHLHKGGLWCVFIVRFVFGVGGVGAGMHAHVIACM